MNGSMLTWVYITPVVGSKAIDPQFPPPPFPGETKAPLIEGA